MTSRPSPVQNPETTGPTRGDGAASLVLVVLPLFSIAAPLNQFKVLPIMPILMAVVMPLIVLPAILGVGFPRS